MKLWTLLILLLAFPALTAAIAGKHKYELILQNESDHQVTVSVKDGFLVFGLTAPPQKTESKEIAPTQPSVGVTVLCTTRYVHSMLRLKPEKDVIRVTVNRNCGEHISY